MAIEIRSIGPMTTIQDRGRQGYGSKGYRECGACDKYAMRIANLLAWNLEENDNSAVVELTLFGGRFYFTEETLIALSGADMSPKLDGVPVSMYQTILVKPGQVLELGAAVQGLRTYLAVNGGIQVPEVMGSRSTDTACRIGGLEGRALKAGDRLECREAVLMTEKFRRMKKKFVLADELFWVKNASFRYRSMGQELIPVMRIVAGPQEESFTQEAMDVLRRSIYQIGADSNRMACRLKGPVLEAVNGYDIVSDGIVEGSVQVSANGQPIVMLADHQTTGGYAKIGTVLSTDLAAIAQRKPGEKIGFLFVTPEEANEAYRLEEKKLQWLRSNILSGGKEHDFSRFEL